MLQWTSSKIAKIAKIASVATPHNSAKATILPSVAVRRQSTLGMRPKEDQYNFFGVFEVFRFHVASLCQIGTLTSPVFEPVFQHKEWERALGILDEMESKEMKPDIISYDAGISACEKACEWEQAIVLLQDLNTKKLQPTIVTCSALISACGNGGEWPLALHFFDEAGLFTGNRSKELGGALCNGMDDILRW